MTKRHQVQVVVGGKVLTMGGSDDELHIQKVAACVNRKLAELEELENYQALPGDLKPILVELNLADDLIQAQETIDMLKNDMKLMQNDLAHVKQSLAETQIQLEELQSSAVQISFEDVGWTAGGDKAAKEEHAEDSAEKECPHSECDAQDKRDVKSGEDPEKLQSDLSAEDTKSAEPSATKKPQRKTSASRSRSSRTKQTAAEKEAAD